MGNSLDAITGQPAIKWQMSPPEITLAENGYVIRTYDIHSDEFRYRIAADVDEVRAALSTWADEVCDGIRRMVDRRVSEATREKTDA